MSASWAEARKIAGSTAIPLPATRVPMAQACGMVLAGSLSALVDLPPFATSAMDGWAVAGPGPWRVTGRVLAGQEATRLGDGEAVEIATGARVPSGASAVLRRERGVVDEHSRLHVGDSRERPEPAAKTAAAPPRTYGAVSSGATAIRTPHGAELGLPIGADIRPQGQESRRGETLLSAGTRITPAVLGLAAAAGYDDLPVHERPRVALVVIGDELAESGLPDGARIRDALGPMFTAWLEALGSRSRSTRVADDPRDLLAAIASSPADLVITTGGTARGPVDHVHGVLAEIGARLLSTASRCGPGTRCCSPSTAAPGSAAARRRAPRQPAGRRRRVGHRGAAAAAPAVRAGRHTSPSCRWGMPSAPIRPTLDGAILHRRRLPRSLRFAARRCCATGARQRVGRHAARRRGSRARRRAADGGVDGLSEQMRPRTQRCCTRAAPHRWSRARIPPGSCSASQPSARRSGGHAGPAVLGDGLELLERPPDAQDVDRGGGEPVLAMIPWVTDHALRRRGDRRRPAHRPPGRRALGARRAAVRDPPRTREPARADPARQADRGVSGPIHS